MRFGKQRSSDGEKAIMVSEPFWFRCEVMLDDYSTMKGEIKDYPTYSYGVTTFVRLYKDDRKTEFLIPIETVKMIKIHLK